MEWLKYNSEKKEISTILKQNIITYERSVIAKLLLGFFFVICWILVLYMIYLGSRNLSQIVGALTIPWFFILTFFDLFYSRRNVFAEEYARIYVGFPFRLSPFLNIRCERIREVVFFSKKGVLKFVLKSNNKSVYYSHFYTEEEMKQLANLFMSNGIRILIKD